MLDRRPEMFRAPLPSVEYVMCDLADTAQIYEALAGVDAVVHLASTTVPATSNLDPAADITGNLVAMVRLLEVMRSTEVRKMVYLSSGGTVYGVPQTDPVREDHPLNPISSYGIVKVAIENYLFMEHKLHGLQYVALRASNPYGPRQGIWGEGRSPQVVGGGRGSGRAAPAPWEPFVVAFVGLRYSRSLA